MKKAINVKEIMIILISVVLITILSTNVFAIGSVLGDDDNSAEEIGAEEYKNAQISPEDKNVADDKGNNVVGDKGNNTIKNNTTNNTVKKYNTNNSKDLPQTGIEDYNIGILLIIGVTSAIFAYKKVSDYRNI